MMSILAALLTGVILPIQGAINSQVGKLSGQFVMIVGVSLVQIAFGAILLFYNHQKITDVISLGTLISGSLGIVAMYGFSYSIANIGTLKVFGLVLMAQIIISIIIDHFGLLGVQAIPINFNRVGSCLLIIAGVYWLTNS